MRKDFYIFRHGETELNRQRRWQGSGMDYDLTTTGVAQAQQLLLKLQDKKLEAIFSSPLIRAKHTADVVAQALQIPVIVRENLKECFYGVAEGQLTIDLADRYPEILSHWASLAPEYDDISFPQGESKKTARGRVLAELQKLTAEKYNVMGVAIHGGTMSQLLNYFNVAYDAIPNCAAFHLVFEDGRWFAVGGIF